MNKGTTINNWVNLIKFEVCSTCKFFNKDFDVCGGEMLPIERAIIKILKEEVIVEILKTLQSS